MNQEEEGHLLSFQLPASSAACLVSPPRSLLQARVSSSGPKAFSNSCSSPISSVLWGLSERGEGLGAAQREAGRRQSVTVTCSCALLSTG